MTRGQNPPPKAALPGSDADTSHADIGMVCAIPLELGAFLARCERVRKYIGSNFVFRGGRYDNIRVVVVESGTGFARARRATQALIDAHSPKWILSCGFAGALVPSIKIGDIVVANSIVDTHGQSLLIDVAFPRRSCAGPAHRADRDERRHRAARRRKAAAGRSAWGDCRRHGKPGRRAGLPRAGRPLPLGPRHQRRRRERLAS